MTSDEAAPKAAQLLDFTKPVAVTLLAILHAIPDLDDPHAIVAQLTDAMPSGNYLAISHLGSDLIGRERRDAIEDAWRGKVQQQITFRDREQVARFFTDLELAEPGLVPLEEWRTQPVTAGEGRSATWCAVGRKP